MDGVRGVTGIYFSDPTYLQSNILLVTICTSDKSYIKYILYKLLSDDLKAFLYGQVLGRNCKVTGKVKRSFPFSAATDEISC